MKRRCLILFVKSPEAPEVKSRLARSIGDRHARALYRCFVPDLLDAVDRGSYRLRLFFTPPEGRPALQAWLGEGRSYEPQVGHDLGERMRKAFEKCFADGFEAAVLIGSDCPDLPGTMMDLAFETLGDHDAVIGPALDGGYYLVGFNADAFLPAAFADLPWGTGTVFADTRTILEHHGLRLSIFPAWRDIDTIDDLNALMAANRQKPFAKSRTMRYAANAELVGTVKT